MSQVVITVQGVSDSFHPPQRGTLALSVGFEGPAKDEVYARTAEQASSIAGRISPMVNPDRGPVTFWSSDQIQTWSIRPWNKDGVQLPLVHHATVGFEVKFSDLARLNVWVTEVAPLRGVSISGVAWTLTVARQLELTYQARVAAVHDARDKARAYAASLGLGEVRVVAIADVGMLGDQVSATSGGGTPMKFAGRATNESGPPLDLKPVDIKVSAAVDARFIAG